MACSGALIDKAALRPPLYTLTVLMAGVQILALGRGPLRYGERLFGHDSALRATGRLRLWLYDEVEPRTPAALGQWRSGDLLSRATADVDSLQDLALRGISPVLVGVISSVFAVILVAIILPAAGLVLAGCLAGALCLTSAVAWARQRGLGTREAALRGELSADVVELLRGAADLVAFGRDEEYLERAVADDKALVCIARRRSWTAGAASALAVAFAGIAVIGLLAVAIPPVGAHRLPGYMLAVLPLVALGAFEIVPPVADAVSRLSHYLAAARRVLAIADLPTPVHDPEDPVTAPAETEITLRDARLRYGADHPWALDGLTMSVPAARRVALVGPSGAGKSSVVNTLLRFWALEGGEATLGGIPLDRLGQETPRRMIAWVAQDTHLFNTTIRGNIALARPEASEAEITEAARAAQLGDWINSLPDGLDTKVGEQGAQLSGGQRQRLALARALLARTPVLVLDEPTSGLDEATAERLLSDVFATTAGKSLLYVTHRLDELAAFDEVDVIDNGRVVSPQASPGKKISISRTADSGPSEP
jgi:thiol reductant ABC exporter CydC subunit